MEQDVVEPPCYINGMKDILRWSSHKKYQEDKFKHLKVVVTDNCKFSVVPQVSLHLVARHIRGRRCSGLPTQVLGPKGARQQRHVDEQDVQVSDVILGLTIVKNDSIVIQTRKIPKIYEIYDGKILSIRLATDLLSFYDRKLCNQIITEFTIEEH